MKRIFALTAAMFFIPFAAFALQPLNDAEMAEITSQGGIAIIIDDVKIFNARSEVWYQTAAAFTSADGSGHHYHGAIGLVTGSEMMHINFVMAADPVAGAMYGQFYSLGGRPLFGDYEAHAKAGFNFGNTGSGPSSQF